MAFTYDLTTDRGKVRLLLRDTDTVTVANQFFTDAEIDAFLDLNGNDGTVPCMMLAAAFGKETMAGDQVMVLKVGSRLDVSTDGSAVARELRLEADVLRSEAKKLIAAADTDAGFDVAEMALGPFSLREQIINEGLREE